MSSPALGIVGIGNVLIGDDAIGPYAIVLLQSRWEWPENVTFVDAGTPGPELATLLEAFDAAIIVDAVDTGAPAGTLVRLEQPAIMAGLTPAMRTPHDPGLTAALLQLELLGTGPSKVALLGMIPDRTNTGAILSSQVRSALSGLLEMVVEEAGKFGCFPKRRKEPLPENIWWEKKP